jgi:hypothetical protein
MKSLLILALTGHLSAPVYSYVGDGVLKRSGTHIYPATADRILYCIAHPPRVTLTCVVHTVNDRLVLVEVIASEAQT